MKKPWRTLLALGPCIALLCVLGGMYREGSGAPGECVPAAGKRAAEPPLLGRKAVCPLGSHPGGPGGPGMGGERVPLQRSPGAPGPGGDQCSSVAVRVGVDRPRGGAVRGCSRG